MPSFTKQELILAGAAPLFGGAVYFKDVTTDTRKITEGALFVALKGERFNGEDFLADAIKKGAAGAVVSRACEEKNLAAARELGATVLTAEDTLTLYQQLGSLHRERFNIPVVAITGSNGKTTTKDLTAAVLSALGPVQKTQANFNNEIGLPLTLLGINETHKAAVVEIGMRGLHQIEALAPLAKPSVGIVTNVGETHLELLGSMENIARAKAELVEAITAGGTVILNADNPYVAAMEAKAADGVRVLTFGLKGGMIRGEAVRTEGDKTLFMVSYLNERHEYTLPMVGRHNVYNALAAVAAGFALGLTAQEIRTGLLSLQATKMRFECQEKNGFYVINDAYNASPMSMKAAIETTASLRSGRKIAVLGDMLELGAAAEKSHSDVGEELARAGFTAVITRGELSKLTAQAAEQGGVAAYIAASHEEAAAILKEIAKPGDTLLFKGSRGMKMEKIIELI